MTALATRTINETKPLNILQRITNKDQTAVKECFDTYGSFIWALARKFTHSPEEAEIATQEIFLDIWRHTERGEIQSAEKLLIAQIARRRLIKHLQ